MRELTNLLNSSSKIRLPYWAQVIPKAPTATELQVRWKVNFQLLTKNTLQVK